MASALLTPVACVIPSWIGACALWWFGLRFRRDGYAFVGWSVMTGTLITGALVFAALWLGATVSTLPWITSLAAIAIGAPRPWRRGVRLPLADEPGSARGTEARGTEGHADADRTRRGATRLEAWLLHGAVALALLWSVDRSLVANATLVTLGDEGNIWSGKAKAIMQAGGLSDALRPALVDHFQEPTAYLCHTDYPPLNPMIQLLVFAWHGEITHYQNRVPIQLQALALLLIVAASLRRIARPWVASLAVLLFASTGLVAEVFRYAAADAMVALGLLAAVDAFGRLHGSGATSAASLRHGFVAAAALGYLVWSKNEGWMLALVLLFAGACTAAARWSDRSARWGIPGARIGAAACFAFLPAVLLVGAQLAFNARYGLRNDLTAPTDGPPLWSRIFDQACEHAPWIGHYTWTYCVQRPEVTQWIFVLLLLVAALFPLRLVRRAPLATFSLAGAILGFFLVYLGTPQDIEWHVSTSMERLLMQLLPLATLVLVSGVTAVFPELGSAECLAEVCPPNGPPERPPEDPGEDPARGAHA